MRHRASQEGQSTIEFILTFMFGLGVVLLFVNVAINYSAGFLAHYATYMAARSYLVVEAHNTNPASSDTLAKNAALNTFKRLKMAALDIPTGSVLPGAGSAAPGLHINGFTSLMNPKDAMYIGAYAVFTRRLSFFRAVAGGTEATLVSEAYLGKEPLRHECWKRTCEAIMLAIKGAPTACPEANGEMTVYDNGC